MWSFPAGDESGVILVLDKWLCVSCARTQPGTHMCTHTVICRIEKRGRTTRPSTHILYTAIREKTFVHPHVHTHMHTYKCTSAYINPRIYLSTCINTHIFTLIQSHLYSHTEIFTHTRTHMYVFSVLIHSLTRVSMSYNNAHTNFYRALIYTRVPEKNGRASD